MLVNFIVTPDDAVAFFQTLTDMKSDTKHWIETPELRLVMIGLLLWHLWEGRVAEITAWWPMKSDPRSWNFGGWDWSLKYTNKIERMTAEKTEIQHGLKVSQITYVMNFYLIHDVINLEALNEQHWTGRHGNSEIVGSLVFFFRAVSRKTASWCSVEELFPWDMYWRQNRSQLTDSAYTDSLLLIIHGSFMHMSCTF